MAIFYHPSAFDARRFTAGLGRCRGDQEVCDLLEECEVDEPAFGWSIDGTSEGDIISNRRHPIRNVSLIDNVRYGLGSADSPRDHVEAARLLGHVSEEDGRLVSIEPFLGYLMPEEIARTAALLAGITLPNDTGQDRDRLLLLRLFKVALLTERGLFWVLG